jgi:predicted DCC family thiol-disulfide oxidoreductase YuxK
MKLIASRRPPAGPTPDGRYWLLWDGECGFCRRAVDWANRRDRAGRLHACPFQQAPSPPMTPELALACERAVHVVTPDGKAVGAGKACLVVLALIGWKRQAILLSLPPMIWLIELGYWIVARNRTLFSRWMFQGE